MSKISRAVFPLLLLVGACGGGSKSPDNVRDFFNDLNDAFCKSSVECGDYPDLATCKSASRPKSTQAMDIADVEAGRIDYDASHAAACLAFIDSFTCEHGSLSYNQLQDTCGPVLVGHLAIGTACVDSEECVSGAACSKPSSCGADVCCAGTCVAAPTGHVALGGDCSVNASCVDGAYCKTNGTGSFCTAQATSEHDVCDAYDGCAAPLYCNINTSTQTGTCYRPAAHGATCDGDLGSEACSSFGDFCDATSKCKARGKQGEACAGDTDCVEYAACVDQTCKNYPTLGQACTVAAGSGSCLGDLVCTPSTGCAAPPAATACP